jgi:hypothetical protein
MGCPLSKNHANMRHRLMPGNGEERLVVCLPARDSTHSLGSAEEKRQKQFTGNC